MSEEELYARNARDYSDRAELYARRAEKAANQLDVPAVVLFTLGLSLLCNCLIVTVAVQSHKVEVPSYAKCETR